MKLPLYTLLASSLSSLLSGAVFAGEPAYTPYIELGVAYNIDQPDSVKSSKYSHRVPLYQGENASYDIETGIKVPTENGDTLKLGVSWYDLLSKSTSSPHNPYYFEVFSDYIWNFDDKMFTSIGVGYKILEQTQINYEYQNGKYRIYTGDNPVTDKITARFSIGRQFGNYSVALVHHSQWLKGYPFNNDWEYQVTKISVNYTF
jgi:hypothetical protein